MLTRRHLLGSLAAMASAAPRATFGQTAAPKAPAAKPGAAPAPLVVVVAKDSALVNLSMNDLRALFLGEARQDPAGTRLIPLNLPANSPERVAFDRVVLGFSPDEAGRYWVDRKIRGEGRPPRTFDSPLLMQRLVAKFPGAVAYVRTATLEPGVRAVRIDGKAPGDPGYPLAR